MIHLTYSTEHTFLKFRLKLETLSYYYSNVIPLMHLYVYMIILYDMDIFINKGRFSK